MYQPQAVRQTAAFDAHVPKRDRDRWATHASAHGDGGTRCGATEGMVGGVVTCPDCLALLR